MSKPLSRLLASPRLIAGLTAALGFAQPTIAQEAKPTSPPVADAKANPARPATDPMATQPRLVQPGAPGQPVAGQPNMVPPSVKPAGPTPTVQLKPGESPMIEFDTPTYDFGRIKAGLDVTHDFWFHNTGSGPLEILAVKPSCGCTTAGPHDRIVAPGEAGKIPIKIGTAHFNGKLNKTISIQTNAAGAGANVVLSVTGELWQVVQITPQNVYFGRILTTDADKAAPAQKLTITTNNNVMAKITDVRSTNPAFKADLTEVEPGKKFELLVSTVPPLKEGNNYGTIDMSTGVAEMPRLTVPVSCMVAPELEVTPNQIVLPPNAKMAMKRPILVRNNNPKAPMKVTAATCNNPKVAIDLKEVQPNTVWQVMVDIPAGYAKEAADGDVISFKSDNEKLAATTVKIVEQPAMAAPMGPMPQPVNAAAAQAKAAAGVAPQPVLKTPAPAAPANATTVKPTAVPTPAAAAPKGDAAQAPVKPIAPAAGTGDKK